MQQVQQQAVISSDGGSLCSRSLQQREAQAILFRLPGGGAAAASIVQRERASSKTLLRAAIAPSLLAC